MSDNESANLIAESIERILAENVDRALLEKFEAGEFPQRLWSLLEESGFHRLLADDPSLGWSDAEPVLRALGYHRAPVPLAETLAGNWLLAQAGLPVEDGAVTITQCDDALRLASRGGTTVLTGTASRVPWGAMAKRLVVSGSLEGKPIVGVVNLAGNAAVRSTTGSNIAFEPRDDLAFADCPFDASGESKHFGVDAVHCVGALIRSACMAGGIASILDQSLQYANDRVQFGKPIGKFQAIQHLLAEVASDSAAATAAVSGACEDATLKGGRASIASAKVRCGEAAVRTARLTHQAHGAIGFTYEHTLHYATRRLWSWRNEFGNDASWARELGRNVIKRGAERFWADITA